MPGVGVAEDAHPLARQHPRNDPLAMCRVADAGPEEVAGADDGGAQPAGAMRIEQVLGYLPAYGALGPGGPHR